MIEEHPAVGISIRDAATVEARRATIEPSHVGG
jgi:hypothetical protein